jgi:hypothetical protein
VAQGRVSLAHAYIQDLNRCCDPAGICGTAKSMVSGEAMWPTVGFFFAKSASTLEVASREAGTMMRPRVSSCRQPDMIVGTDDCGELQELLRGI